MAARSTMLLTRILTTHALIVGSHGWTTRPTGAVRTFKPPAFRRRTFPIQSRLAGLPLSDAGPPSTQSGSKAVNQLLVQAILDLPQMQDKELIHLSLVGSRSKGLANVNSDYDVKAVILHSAEDYLLQNITPSQSFLTTITDPQTGGAVEVGGNLVDHQTMQKYALSTNPSAYDALLGLPLYETPASKQLEDLFQRAYQYAHQPLAKGFVGHLRRLRQKVRNNRDAEHNIKIVSNMVYYAAMVHFLNTTNERLPPQDAFQVLEQLHIPPELASSIQLLYEQRNSGQTSSSDLPLESFASFVREAEDMVIPKGRIDRESDEFQDLQAMAKKSFLDLVYASIPGRL